MYSNPIAKTDDKLTLEERLEYKAETVAHLTPEQQQKLFDTRRAEYFIEQQEKELGIDSKYVARPLPGNTNDDRWICLKAHFPQDRADKYNWLLGSTSGIHGSSTTLDNLEDPHFLEENELDPRDIEAFTILIIQPRVVRFTYGTVGIRSEDDANWLRGIIIESIAEIAKANLGNVP